MKQKKNRKKVVLLAAGVMLLLNGCSGKKEDSVKQIQETGTLQIALINTDSSYTCFENGIPIGTEPELCDTIAQALGVTPDYQLLNKEEALQAISDGQADIAIGCIPSSGSLSAQYLSSTPYGMGFFYAVTKKGDYTMTIGALEHSAVGTASGISEETKVRLSQAEGITLQTYSGSQEASRAIKNGTIRAYLCYENQAEELAEDPDLQVQNLLNLDAEEFVIVTGKEQSSLISGINTLIRQFLEKES